MAIVSVSIAPLGTTTPSVSEYVAAAQQVLQKYSELTFRLDPMFTTIQGDLPTIFAAIHEMHEAMVQHGAVRLSTVIKIDDRRDKESPMDEKVARVREHLE